jgi:hypothetical protein
MRSALYYHRQKRETGDSASAALQGLGSFSFLSSFHAYPVLLWHWYGCEGESSAHSHGMGSDQ